MTVIVERATAAVAAPRPGRMLLQIISPGEGSSGYYPPATLEAAAKAKVFARGTHTYLDHPSQSEEYDRPERSVRDLVGVLAEDARWTGSALVAECDVFASWRDRMVELAPHIGVSIRAFAAVEARPATTPTVTRIESVASVDFVTQAGRGGRVLQVLESAGRGGSSSTYPSVEDFDEAFDQAVVEAFGRKPAPRPVLTPEEAFDVVMAPTFWSQKDPARLAEANRVVDADLARNRTNPRGHF